MLHGIGGRTIEEAKETLTHDEFVAWCEYIARRGTLNLGTRMEHGFALVAHVLTAVNGQKTRIEDFLPKRKQDEPEASINDVFKLLKGVRKKNGNA